jgi:sugar/nucleoside kinase (ribokinase family)
MSLLVVGSVALDTVSTPFGEARETLGGSACYFSTAASFFCDVQLVAVVGEDFPPEHVRFLQERNIDLSGLQRSAGQTFRWTGHYNYNLNEAQTLDTRLNVFETFKPQLSEQHRQAEYVFLANIDPELQLGVLQQVRKPLLVACDTMNFWIEGKRDALIKTLGHVDILIINEAEVRQLANEPNLVRAADIVRGFGPQTLIVKRGEYGVLMFTRHAIFAAPAYPLEAVFDPTGAGDTFAGGFFGYLAATRNPDEARLRRATVFGSVMASFTVEKFSLDRLRGLEMSEIQDRYNHLRAMTEFTMPD